jgi:hypothetical protein
LHSVALLQKHQALGQWAERCSSGGVALLLAATAPHGRNPPTSAGAAASACKLGCGVRTTHAVLGCGGSNNSHVHAHASDMSDGLALGVLNWRCSGRMPHAGKTPAWSSSGVLYMIYWCFGQLTARASPRAYLHIRMHATCQAELRLLAVVPCTDGMLASVTAHWQLAFNG